MSFIYKLKDGRDEVVGECERKKRVKFFVFLTIHVGDLSSSHVMLQNLKGFHVISKSEREGILELPN